MNEADASRLFEATVSYQGRPFRLLHSDESDHIFRVLKTSGAFYEAEFLAALAKHVRSGDLVLDVGANIGTHTVFLAGICGARVMAFEPNPDAVNLLRANVEANGLGSRVEVRQIGLGASVGRARIDASKAKGNLGASQLVAAPMGDASIEILDNIEFPSSPKLLKIDVEGMDFGVLQGAKKTIEAARPVVAVEAADRGQYDQIAAFLEELGYVHAESYNYTPTHIFVVSAARTTSAVKQIAREMGRNYIETSTVRSLSDSRFSHMNGKLVALEQAQAATTMADKEGREAIAAVSGALDKVRDEHADRIKMVARSLDAERAQTSERLHQQEVSIETIQAAVSNFGDRWLIALEQIEAGAAAQSGRLDRHQLEIAEAMRANAKADSEKWSALRDAIRERDTEGRERLAALCERLEKVLWAQTGDSAAKRDAALAGLERRLTEIEAAREAEATASSERLSLRLEEFASAVSVQLTLLTDRQDTQLAVLRERIDALMAEQHRKAEVDAQALEVAFNSRIEQAMVVVDGRLKAVAERLDTTAGAIEEHIDILLIEQRRRAEAESSALGSAFDIRFEKLESVVNEQLKLLDERQGAEVAALSERFQAVVVDVGARAQALLQRQEAFKAEVSAGFSEAKTHSSEAVAESNRQLARIAADMGQLRDNVGTAADALAGERARLLAELNAAIAEKVAVVEGGVDALLETHILSGAWLEDQLAEVKGMLAGKFDHARQLVESKISGLTRTFGDAMGTQLADLILEMDRRLPRQASTASPSRRRFFDSGREAYEPVAPRLRLLRSTASVHEPSHDSSRSMPQVSIQESPPPTPAIKVESVAGDDDFRAGWSARAWPQRGARLLPDGEVIVSADEKYPGIVTRLYDAEGGGVLRISIELAGSSFDAEVVARVRSNENENLGPDTPLHIGSNEVLVFAPLRTRKLKIYILAKQPRADSSFCVGRVRVDRLDANSYQAAVAAKIGEPVLASLASIPSRRNMLQDCVNSLLAQCDRVRVFLNQYDDVPDFLHHPRVDVGRSQDWDDRGDAGKFFWIGSDSKKGYRLITDDDLLFPPNFVEIMSGKVRQKGDQAIYATHGVLLRQPFYQYYDGAARAATFHFARELKEDRAVHIGATNAMFFHAGTVDMKWSDFKYCNSADVWISLYAQRHGVPILTPARPQGWVRENQHEAPEETIYNHSRKRTKTRFDSSLVQDAVLRYHGPLTIKPAARRKLGVGFVASSREALDMSTTSWLATRSLDVDWVVFLIAEGEPGFLRAAPPLKIEHETHLVESGDTLERRLSSLRARSVDLGVEALLLAHAALRFPERDWEAGVFAAFDQGLANVTQLKALGSCAILSPSGVSGGSACGAVLHFEAERKSGDEAGRRPGVFALTCEDAFGDSSAAAIAAEAARPLNNARRLNHTNGARAPQMSAPLRINDVFERVVVLNLERRPDRWAQVKEQLDRFGIKADRFSAVDGSDPAEEAEYEVYARSALLPVPSTAPIRSSVELYLSDASQVARASHIEQRSGKKAIASKGAWGYLKSYRRILEQALTDQVESLLVFDDDIILHQRTSDLFASAMAEAPSDWLVMQLGTLQYNWDRPWHEPVSRHLYRTNGCAIGSHAVGMRFDVMPFLLDQANRMDMPYDVGALSAATRAYSDRCFVIQPHIAIQRLGSESDINTSDFQKASKVEEMAATYRWKLSEYLADSERTT